MGIGKLISTFIMLLIIANILSTTIATIPVVQVRATPVEASEVEILIVNIEKVLATIKYRLILLEREGVTIPPNVKKGVNEITKLLSIVREKYREGKFDEAKRVALRALEIACNIIERTPIPREYSEYLERVIVESDVKGVLVLVNILNNTLVKVLDYIDNKTVIENIMYTIFKVKEILETALHIVKEEPKRAREIVRVALLNVSRTHIMLRSVAESVGIKRIEKIIRAESTILARILDKITSLERKVTELKDIARVDIALSELEKAEKLIDRVVKEAEKIGRVRSFRHAFSLLESSLKMIRSVKIISSIRGNAIEKTIEVLEDENVIGIARAILAQAQALEKALTGLKVAVEHIPIIPSDVKKNITMVIDEAKNLTQKIRDLVGYILVGDFDNASKILEDLKAEVKKIQLTISSIEEELKATPGPHIGILKSIKNIIIRLVERVEQLTKKVLKVEKEVEKELYREELIEEAKEIIEEAIEHFDKVIDELKELKEELIVLAKEANTTDKVEVYIEIIDKALEKLEQLKDKVKSLLENVTNPIRILREVEAALKELHTTKEYTETKVTDFILIVRDIVLDNILSTLLISESLLKQVNVTRDELRELMVIIKELKTLAKMLKEIPKDCFEAIRLLSRVIEEANELIKELKERIKEIVSEVIEEIIEAVEELLERIARLEGELETVVSEVSTIVKILNVTIDMSTLEELLVKLKLLKEKLSNITLIVNINTTEALTLLNEVRKELEELLKEYEKELTTIVNQVVEKVKEYINSVIEELRNLSVKAEKAELDEIVKLVNSAIEKLNRALEKLEKLKDKPTAILKLVREILEEVKEVVEDVKEDIKEALKNILDEMKDKLLDLKSKLEELKDLIVRVSIKVNATDDVESEVRKLKELIDKISQLAKSIERVENKTEVLIDLVILVRNEIAKVKTIEAEVSHNVTVKIKDKILVNIEVLFKKVNNTITLTVDISTILNITTIEEYIKSLMGVRECLENLKSEVEELPVNATTALSILDTIADKLLELHVKFKEECKELKSKLVDEVESRILKALDKLVYYWNELEKLYKCINITDYTELEELKKVIDKLKILARKVKKVLELEIEEALKELKSIAEDMRDLVSIGLVTARKGVDKVIDYLKETLEKAKDELNRGKSELEELGKIVDIEKVKKVIDTALDRIEDIKSKLDEISKMDLDSAFKELKTVISIYIDKVRPLIDKAKQIIVRARKCLEKQIVKLFENLKKTFKALNETIENIINLVKVAKIIPEDEKLEIIEGLEKVRKLIAKSIEKVKDSIVYILEGELEKAKANISEAESYMDEAKNVISKVSSKLSKFMREQSIMLEKTFNACMEALNKIISAINSIIEELSKEK
ncbi:MAG TPA: hypothetical protein EYH40_03185 [Desulfurococcales archaeon]|nr:hypothetical protein [Desulfurococcales archaeon]